MNYTVTSVVGILVLVACAIAYMFEPTRVSINTFTFIPDTQEVLTELDQPKYEYEKWGKNITTYRKTHFLRGIVETSEGKVVEYMIRIKAPNTHSGIRELHEYLKQEKHTETSYIEYLDQRVRLLINLEYNIGREHIEKRLPHTLERYSLLMVGLIESDSVDTVELF